MLFRSARRPAMPATRTTPYAPPPGTPPSYGQVQLNPAYSSVTNAAVNQVATTLGDDWAQRLQAAAASGDWATYNSILNQANAVTSQSQFSGA